MSHTRFNLSAVLITLILICAAAIIPVAAQTPAPRSVLATGRWIKIHVKSSDIYKISYSTLAEWGFSDPSKVYIYGYGSVENAHNLDTAPSDLPTIPVLRTSDAIIFYGEGDMRVLPSSANAVSLPIRNYYSRGSWYFLSDVAPDTIPQIEEMPYNPSADSQPLTSHISIDFRKSEEYNEHNAGVYFYSTNLSHGLVKEFNFDISAYDSGGTLGFRYVGRTWETGKKICVTLSPGMKTGSLVLSNIRPVNDNNTLYNFSSKTVSVTPASETPAPFTVKFSTPSVNDFDFLAVDYVYYTYRKLNKFRSPATKLEFYNTTSTPTISITDSPSDLKIWDVTTPRNPVSLIPKIDDVSATALASLPYHPETARLYAFSPSANLPEPAFAGELPNASLNSMDGVELLIITVPSYHNEAERLAQAHREYQGISVAVVDQQDVFNEFSSGAPHPNAIRKFAKMLYQRTETPLRYLLLFGCGTFDNRRVSIADDTDYLITYEVEYPDYAASNAKDYCSDQYFGMFPDRIPDNLSSSDIPVNIGVGRIPALNISEASAYIDKCISYLSDPLMAGDYHHTILIADYGNNNSHILGGESSATTIGETLPGATVTKLYEALYPHTDKQSAALYAALRQKVASSPRIINYTGHADINALGSNIILSAANEKSLNYGSLPILFLATCKSLPIDNPYRGIGSQMVLKKTGPIAAIGSAREVFINYNHDFNDAFLEQYYKATAGDCIGDIYRRAYNASSDIPARRTNNLCYNLVGDPALPAYAPAYNISVSGTDDKSPITLVPLSATYLSGTITGQNGELVSTFNGTLTLRLYAPAIKMSSYIHTSGDTSEPITLDETILTQRIVDVVDGKWSAELILPRNAPEGTCRLTCSAISSTNELAASAINVISILPTELDPDTDTTAPEITISIDNNDTNGSIEVGTTSILDVSISDTGTGIDLNNESIGSAPAITLDGIRRLPDATQLIQPVSNGGAKLTYTLANLPDGEHTVSVSARDLAGNSATETLSFTVINSDAETALYTDNTIAREAVEFDLRHSLSSVTSVRLIILDINGNTIFSKSGITFPFKWELVDNDGNKVDDGTYRVSAIINAQPRFTSSPEVEITVVKHLNPNKK